MLNVHNNNNSKVVSTFPLPKIQELLSRLIHCKYFSSFDLHSGCYHISLTEEAKKKTAFVTADGKYQWNVVPFGLATAVSTFQYQMSKVLPGLNYFVFTYLDDVLISYKSWEEHLQHLKTVFNRFKTTGLKIKVSKYQFFKTQLHYLGHMIPAGVLELLPEKFEAITNLAPSKNVDEARKILGLLGYYSSFTPAFADIIIPITNLLKENVPFVWSKQCQTMLDYSKEFFCSKPILQFPDPNKDYALYTDASNNASSDVLCHPHNNDNDIKPVAYFSVAFTAQNKS